MQRLLVWHKDGNNWLDMGDRPTPKSAARSAEPSELPAVPADFSEEPEELQEPRDRRPAHSAEPSELLAVLADLFEKPEELQVSRDRRFLRTCQVFRIAPYDARILEAVKDADVCAAFTFGARPRPAQPAAGGVKLDGGPSPSDAC